MYLCTSISTLFYMFRNGSPPSKNIEEQREVGNSTRSRAKVKGTDGKTGIVETEAEFGRRKIGGWRVASNMIMRMRESRESHENEGEEQAKGWEQELFFSYICNVFHLVYIKNRSFWKIGKLNFKTCEIVFLQRLKRDTNRWVLRKRFHSIGTIPISWLQRNSKHFIFFL